MTSGGLRASDGDRDQVAEVLHRAYAEGRIDHEEHSDRLQATIAAKTFDDLRPLTADLVPGSAVSPPAPSVAAAPTDQGPDRMTAALSEVKREGQWRVRPRSLAQAFLGSVKLDLTEAVFDAPVVEINISQFGGSIVLRVPLGVSVRDETTNVLSDISVKGIGRPDPSYPTIVLKGTSVLSEIKVRGPRRPPLWKRALA